LLTRILKNNTEKDIRGLAGAAGNRSMITDRGGTGRAAKFRTTRKKVQINTHCNRFFSILYLFEKQQKLVDLVVFHVK
jgi:hypothetical protein